MKNRLREISKNIFPGFVVSLIALPLSLGLALAAGVPPVAGLISAIVGGIIVSLIGGSYITITGPGNGLVVATFGALVSLGGEDLYQGYLYVLAAVIFSGVLTYLLGVFRFGALGSFFPSAAVQGMLAAIGLLIMARQLHVMIGEVNPEATEALDLYTSLHHSAMAIFKGEIPALAYVIGIGSLIFLFIYSKIRGRLVHLIPAPMWIVLISIGLTYFSRKFPAILTPLPEEFVLKIPGELIGDFNFPDFGKVLTMDFWVAVFGLTFIATVESLLSIKGIDQLDPYKRRSNVNKDLRALGIATVVSGFLGGLNVVTVIARSSVNVNNGAKNRSSNFFHGLFLLLFLLLFADPLNHIPLPALAAILVYTGYKLAEPAVFVRIARVGWEQLAIFLITLIVTVISNLITGIFAGILATIIFQLRVMKRFNVLIRYLWRPNTLLYEESPNQYLLSVKAFSNFMNFGRLKKGLDSIPSNSKVIIDFTLTEFVDYSVLEQLDGYHHNFKSKGGEVEIIGLDNLKSTSPHPLAPKLPSSHKLPSKSALSRRQKGLKLFSKKLNWSFASSEFSPNPRFYNFKYFKTKVVDKGRSRVTGMTGDVQVIIADIDYHEGEFIARESKSSTMVILKLPYAIPKFVLDKENLLDRVARLAGFGDINFAKHPQFSHNFKLKARKTGDLFTFFDDDLITFLEGQKQYHVESNGEALLIFEKERVAVLSEIKQLVSFASKLAALLDSKKTIDA